MAVYLSKMAATMVGPRAVTGLALCGDITLCSRYDIALGRAPQNVSKQRLLCNAVVEKALFESRNVVYSHKEMLRSPTRKRLPQATCPIFRYLRNFSFSIDLVFLDFFC